MRQGSRSAYLPCNITPGGSARSRVERVEVAIAGAYIYLPGSHYRCRQDLCASRETPVELTMQRINARNYAAIIPDTETTIRQGHTAAYPIDDILRRFRIQLIDPALRAVSPIEGKNAPLPGGFLDRTCCQQRLADHTIARITRPQD